MSYRFSWRVDVGIRAGKKPIEVFLILVRLYIEPTPIIITRTLTLHYRTTVDYRVAKEFLDLWDKLIFIILLQSTWIGLHNLEISVIFPVYLLSSKFAVRTVHTKISDPLSKLCPTHANSCNQLLPIFGLGLWGSKNYKFSIGSWDSCQADLLK